MDERGWGEDGAVEGGLRFLRAADPTLGRLIDAYGTGVWEERIAGRPREPFAALLRAIVGQQLSVAAARAVYARLQETFGGRTPKPREVLAADPAALRAAGLSQAKVRYLRGLAERALAGELSWERLAAAPDEEVVATLEALPGVGRWTAQMFLIFQLGRLDVLPAADLGLRRAIGRHYGLSETPTAAAVARLGERWAPYRSLATVYLWRSLSG